MARRIFIPPRELRASRRSREVEELRGALTVREWADDWLARLADAGRSPGTTRSYRSTLDAHVLPAIGAMRLAEVSQDDVDAMLAKLKGKPGAWANAARTTRSLFLAAVSARAGGLTESPVSITIPKPVKSRETTVRDTDLATPAEVRAMAAGMPPALAIGVLLAAWCSLRLGEVLGLQRGDFDHLEDPDKAVVHVRRQWNSKASPPAYTEPKADSRRTLSIPPALVPEIVDHLGTHTRPERTAPFIPSSQNPTMPASQTAFDLAWRKAREPVRPGFRFHSLRHTGLTAYAQAGATLKELQERGGHKDAAVALRYQHATLERDRALAKKLDVGLEA
ncbi:tyrosine-type recombinase/integrase [Demequina sp.]|uniref:tyrosine-type recombinase/integrase n=1 Tax=Demequina sp. TaxID=2050685 RepID=UPI003D141725